MMKYHGAPLYYTDLLSDCNLVFTILFTIECVMKVGCFGPKVKRNICGLHPLASLDEKSRSIILDPPYLTFRARPFALVGHLTAQGKIAFLKQWCSGVSYFAWQPLDKATARRVYAKFHSPMMMSIA